MKREEMKFTVRLAGAGNPDHEQFFDGEVLSPSLQKRCASVLECQRAVRLIGRQLG
jgi:hypothetical protein